MIIGSYLNGEGPVSQRVWGYLLIAAAVAASLLLPSIGQRTLYTSDEVRFALLARGAVEEGHWLVPRIGHEIHMEKPPFFVWAIALFSLLGGGVTEFTSALPAAISGIGGVAGTFLLGRRLFGVRAGFLSGLILATTPVYVWHGRVVLADMTVTLFVVLSAWAFWGAVETPRRRRGWIALFYFFLALALSAKGPVGLVPILPFGAFLLSEEGWRGMKTLRPLMGGGILALVSAPWAIAFALQRETSYIQSVLLEDYLWWYFGAWRSSWDVFFVLGPLFIGFLPWSLFLPIAVREGAVHTPEADTHRKFRFLLFWVLAYLIVITLMAEKRTRYLLPMYPALALTVGWVWDQWAVGRIRANFRLYAWLCGGLEAGAAAVLFLPIRFPPHLAVFLPSTLAQKFFVLGLFMAGAVSAALALQGGRVLKGFAVFCLTMELLLLYDYTRILIPQYNRTYDVKGFSATILSHVRPDDQLVAFQYQHLSYDFYLKRTVREIQDPKELSDQLSQNRTVYFLADERAWRKFHEATGRAWPVVARADIAGSAIFLGTNVPASSSPPRATGLSPGQ